MESSKHGPSHAQPAGAKGFRRQMSIGSELGRQNKIWAEYGQNTRVKGSEDSR